MKLDTVDTQYGRTYLIRHLKYGALLMNRNLEKRLRRISPNPIDALFKLPEDWHAAVRGNWMYRVASLSYVDVPAGAVQGIVRNLGEFIEFGKWGNWVRVIQGATYISVNTSVGLLNHPKVGEFTLGLHLWWGNDGYTAFHVTYYAGVLKCVNGLIMGYRASVRLLHARSSEAVLARIREAVGGVFRINAEAFIDELLRTPVDYDQLTQVKKRLGYDFMRLWEYYRGIHGENMLAFYQALSWFATHSGERASKYAVKAMAVKGA